MTERQLNRALLARQHLLERVDRPIQDVLVAMAGLQAQYAPSMYIGLWTRVAGFQRADLTRRLEDRSVVQGTLLRVTIHLVAAGEWWPFSIATRQTRRTWWLRAQRTAGVERTETEMIDAAARVADQLANQGSLSARELEAIAGKGRAGGIGLWLDLVRVPPTGTWERRRADQYASAERWIGPPPAGLSEDRAVDHLVTRYLTAFGPATPKDIATFCGLPVGAVTPSFDRIGVRRFRSPVGRPLVDVIDGLLPDPETTAPVRFLPTFDATLLVHCRRTGILGEQHRPLIFTSKNPQSVGTFLVDGVVAGTWTWNGDRVQVAAFESLRRGYAKAVAAEADRLSDFHR